MNLKQAVLLIGVVGGGVAGNACDYNGFDNGDACVDPKNSYYISQLCVELRRDDACWNKARDAYYWPKCEEYRKDPLPILEGFMGWRPDAGADAADASDAADKVDGSSVRMGRCGPNAPDNYSDPESVWFGPISDAPTLCPEKTGFSGSPTYAKVDESKFDGCALCGCERITGTCSLPANTIHFRDDLCDGDANLMTNFGPLENWDGSCSTDHAIVASAECPLESGIPCVQSFYAWALPEPHQECKAIEIQVPQPITDVPKWKDVALSCASTIVVPSDELRKSFPADKRDIYDACVPGGEGFRTCVQPKELGLNECNSNSLFSAKIVMYEESGFIDKRHCSACGCEASGGACVGTLNVYEDDACGSILATEMLDSSGPTCDDLLPPGKAIGSKDLQSLDYVPGNCKATGGIVQGHVIEDEAKAVIWCCLTEESALYNIDL